MSAFDPLRWFRRWWPVLPLTTAACLLLTALFLASHCSVCASALLEFQSTDADPDEVTAAPVVRRALEQLGLDASVETLRARLAVDAVPQQAASEEEAAAPTLYRVRYTVRGSTDTEAAARTLNAVLDCYLDSLTAPDSDAALPPAAASELSAEDEEYLDCVDLLLSRAAENAAWLDKQAAAAPNFYCAQTGDSFADLAEEYRAMADGELHELRVFILFYKLVKDPDQFISAREGVIAQKQREIDRLTQEITNTEELLRQMEQAASSAGSNVTDPLPASGAAGQNSSAHDTLLAQCASLYAARIDAEAEQTRAKEVLRFYQSAEASADSPEAQQAAQKLDALVQEFDALYTRTVTAARAWQQLRLAETVTVKGSVLVTKTPHLALYLALAAIVSVFVGTLLVFVLGRAGDLLRAVRTRNNGGA